MKKEIDFSKGQRGKYAGKKIIIVGDRRAQLQPNPTDKAFQFTNQRTGRAVEIRAANRKEARATFLTMFNLKRMPTGFEISELKLVA